MRHEEHGFTITELMLVIAALAIITATAMPSVLNSLQDYRLHTDSSTLASMCNLARLRAAAQFAPYRVNVDVTAGTYTLERLCGNTDSSIDSACTSSYSALTSPHIESGTQYVLPGTTLSTCRPPGISTFPSPLTADTSGCPNAMHLYFNTRGAPVDSSGSPLSSGGAVVYLKNRNDLVDALTLSVGGRVAVWNWDSSATKWCLR